MAVNFKPSPGFVLIEPIAVKVKETRGKANIIMPGQSVGKADNFNSVEEIFDEWPFQAIVKSIGESLPNIPIDVSIGDIVYLSREMEAKDAVLVQKKVYAYIRSSEIIGKIISHG